MKKYLLFILILFTSTMLAACGGSDDEVEAMSEAEAENINNYLSLVSHSIDESNRLLNKIGQSLDLVYTGERNLTTFRSEIQRILPESNEIQTEMDDAIYMIRPGMFDFHRELISMLSKQHAMFLKAIDDISEDKFSKADLQQKMAAIKIEQTRVVESLQTLIGE